MTTGMEGRFSFSGGCGVERSQPPAPVDGPSCICAHILKGLLDSGATVLTFRVIKVIHVNGLCCMALPVELEVFKK